MNPKIFPTVLIVLSLAAAVPYFAAGDWRRGLYWLFASGLQLVVTY